MFNTIYLHVFVAVFVATVTAESEVVVKTPLGSVQGKHIKSYEGRTVTAFEGIPYAKPPIGDLRFKEPQPIEKWSDTLVADKTYTCMQYTATALTSDVVGDEDCLYLYIYVPREAITGKEKMDVVVHIHGGASPFVTGDPKSLAGPDYIMDRDIVYVSMNYRLGILGFLSTQDKAARGNYGLKDQVLAMRWVKENIEHFGGNPNSITLTGFSAGGASVHYHYLSPLTKGLFNRGISHSGTALNTWALTKNPVRNVKKLGQLLDCHLETSKELVDCLRSKPVKDVVLAHANFTVFANAAPPTVFAPVVELAPGAFLPDHPYKLMLEGRIHAYPWITSNTKVEGLDHIALIKQHDKLQELGNHWDELAPYALDYNDTVHEFNKKAIAKILRTRYLKDEPLSEKNVLDLAKLSTDRYYYIDAIKALSLQATVVPSPVYYYLFDYSTEAASAYKGNVSAAGHGDDCRLLYHFADNPKELSDSDHKMKNIFIDFLYRYASTGNPDFKGVPWIPIYKTPEAVSYTHITSPDNIRSEWGLNLEPFAFWHHLPLRENENLFPYLLDVVQYLPVF